MTRVHQHHTDQYSCEAEESAADRRRIRNPSSGFVLRFLHLNSPLAFVFDGPVLM